MRGVVVNPIHFRFKFNDFNVLSKHIHKAKPIYTSLDNFRLNNLLTRIVYYIPAGFLVASVDIHCFGLIFHVRLS